MEVNTGGYSLCQDAAVSVMEARIADIKKWTRQNSRMLNDDKTEFIVIGTRQQLAKVNVTSIRVGIFCHITPLLMKLHWLPITYTGSGSK